MAAREDAELGPGGRAGLAAAASPCSAYHSGCWRSPPPPTQVWKPGRRAGLSGNRYACAGRGLGGRSAAEAPAGGPCGGAARPHCVRTPRLGPEPYMPQQQPQQEATAVWSQPSSSGQTGTHLTEGGPLVRDDLQAWAACGRAQRGFSLACWDDHHICGGLQHLT